MKQIPRQQWLKLYTYLQIDFYSYRKWADVKDLSHNDSKRVNVSRILNFKNGSEDDYAWFRKCFANHIQEFAGEQWIICSIPGHDQTLPIANHMDKFLKSIDSSKN